MAGFLGHNSFIAPGCLFTNFGALCTGPFSMQVLTHQDLRDPGSYVNVNTPLGPIVNCCKLSITAFYDYDATFTVILKFYNFGNVSRILKIQRAKQVKIEYPVDLKKSSSVSWVFRLLMFYF